MPSQSTQSVDPSFSSSSSKNRDSQPLLPLTVKQISEALQSIDDKANFFIDGVDVNNVTLVGLVFNKTERVTDVAFVIDDGTGRIDCIKWNSEAVDNKEMERILNGMYVRVHGHLKGFQGKKQLVVFSVRPLDDYNEIAYHFVECMYVHNYNTKIRKLQGVGPTHSMTNTAFGASRGYQSAPPNQYSGAGHTGMDALKEIDQMVIDYLQQPQCLSREKGVPINEISQRLNMSAEKVTISIKSLEDDGLVYSTIDDYHYKSTGNA